MTAPGAPLPPGVAGEAVHPARAIVAETGAGGAAVAAVADSGRGSAAAFLAARQARLAAAADDVVAAEDGSAAALSRPLRRFEALTPALWTVRLAICALAHRRPGPGAHLAGPAAIGGGEGNGVNAAGFGLTWTCLHAFTGTARRSVKTIDPSWSPKFLKSEIGAAEAGNALVLGWTSWRDLREPRGYLLPSSWPTRKSSPGRLVFLNNRLRTS